jgi:hypothetical protein
MRHARLMPAGARWWLWHCRPLGIAEAEAVGLESRDAWQASALHFDRPNAETSRFWTREDLRAAGHGQQIDALVREGRCPADGWRLGRPRPMLNP